MASRTARSSRRPGQRIPMDRIERAEQSPYLEVSTYEGSDCTPRLQLVRCPACGLDLRDRHPPDHLLEDHGPADFGLSPWDPAKAATRADIDAEAAMLEHAAPLPPGYTPPKRERPDLNNLLTPGWPP